MSSTDNSNPILRLTPQSAFLARITRNIPIRLPQPKFIALIMIILLLGSLSYSFRTIAIATPRNELESHNRNVIYETPDKNDKETGTGTETGPQNLGSAPSDDAPPESTSDKNGGGKPQEEMEKENDNGSNPDTNEAPQLPVDEGTKQDTLQDPQNSPVNAGNNPGTADGQNAGIENSGPVAFVCQPVGSCIPCSDLEKAAQPYCLSTGYKQPISCVIDSSISPAGSSHQNTTRIHVPQWGSCNVQGIEMEGGSGGAAFVWFEFFNSVTLIASYFVMRYRRIKIRREQYQRLSSRINNV